MNVDISDEAISQMELGDFLAAYGDESTRDLAAHFAAMYCNGTLRQDPVIDLDVYVSLMVTQNRPNILKTLRAVYVEGTDYVMRDLSEAELRQRGGQLRKHVLLTPDCFKNMCMRSRASAAETARMYLTRLEALTQRHFAAILSVSHRK